MGGAAAQLLADPGPVVRWGLPIARLLVNIGAAGMIGALVLTCFALSPKEREFNTALDFAAASAAFFTVASAVTGFFTMLQVTNVPLSFDDRFSSTAGQFFTQIALGQAWLITTLIGAAITVLCFAVRNQTALVFVTIFSVVALLPMAQQGHSAEASGHNAAVTALSLHLIFAAIWLGGLLTIVMLRKQLGDKRLIVVLGRYSSVALVCFIVVAASGYISAELRLGTFDKLLTPYGILVLTKVAVLLILGCFGVVQRRFFIDRMQRAQQAVAPWFWWLVVAELGFMGIASGVAAALAKTATPVVQVATTEIPTSTPAQLLTGSLLPPPLTFERYFTEWNIDLLWVLFCAFGIFFYLAGVRRLRKRGDKWSVLRTISWVLGMITLFYITNGGVNVYQQYLFSTHMLSHMALTMMVPVLLVPGAPVTLAARAIAKRKDGSRGPREWILLTVHSKVGRHPGQPVRRSAALRRLALGVLLHADFQLGDHGSPRARVDGGALSDHRLPVRAVADRHRPGSLPVAVRVPVAASARHDGLPCVLRPGHHDRHRPDAGRLVWRNGLGERRPRRPANGRRHRLERGRDPDHRAGDRRGGPVEPERRERNQATRPQRRPHR